MPSYRLGLVLLLTLLAQQSKAQATWTDVGYAHSGTGGTPPTLVGEGTLFPGDPMSLELMDATPGAPATLFIATSSMPTAFKGGTLAANPWVLLVQGLVVGSTGDLQVGTLWPAGIPSGIPMYFQYVIQDSGPPMAKVYSLSNAVHAVTPGPPVDVEIKMWGAGGGAGGNTYPDSKSGGGGGFATGIWRISSGTELTVLVGEGGHAGKDNKFGGGGGGRSEVRIESSTLLVAGAGGGGSRSNFEDPPGPGNPGGAGGGLEGLTGQVPGFGAGGGGTQTVGGVEGFGPELGEAGSQYTGGNAGGDVSTSSGVAYGGGGYGTGDGVNYTSGGGGGGWYGGGGAGTNHVPYYGGGGGGGSAHADLAHPGYVTSALAAGCGAAPAKSGTGCDPLADMDWTSPWGNGGQLGGPGSDGRVLIRAFVSGAWTAWTQFGFPGAPVMEDNDQVCIITETGITLLP